MIGYIILGLTLAAFASIGIWVLIKMFRSPKLPSGCKIEITFADNKAILIIDNNINTYIKNNKIEGFVVNEEKYSLENLKNYCVKAIAATEIGFKNKKIKTDIKEIVFVFQPDDVFQKLWNSKWPSNISVGAYTTEIKTMFNIKQSYVVYIRSKFMKNIFENGHPIIHESIHILNKEAGLGYNKPHDDKNLWARHGKNTVEAIAIEYWKTLLGK